MTRKKVTLAYITNDSERRASFKKRKKGLIKKVSELSTLCGVDACAIIYSKFEAEPEVWPSRAGAQAVLARFRRMSVMDQSRKMVNQESFTRQRIKKSDDQLRRLLKENRRRQMERCLYMNIYGLTTLDTFNPGDAADMMIVVNQVLQDINSRMEMLKKDALMQQETDNVAAPPPLHVAPELSFNLQGAPLTNAKELEGFPWNLVQCPPCDRLDDYGLGWDDGMMVPYPYVFGQGAGTSGT